DCQTLMSKLRSAKPFVATRSCLPAQSQVALTNRLCKQRVALLDATDLPPGCRGGTHRSNLISGRGRVAVDFWLGQGVDEEAYPQRSGNRGATQPKAKSDATRRARALRGVWRRCSLAPYKIMRVCALLAPCQPPQTALARSPPIYEMASKADQFYERRLSTLGAQF